MAEIVFAGLVIGAQIARARPGARGPRLADVVARVQAGWAWRLWPTTPTPSARRSRSRCRRRCNLAHAAAVP
jgi:hypothetical protein